mmetsp:Transcript_6019/g.4547  ORF Transcript_6019/g.4547 Transcript_6019/m.4547 type:complete len:91 (+) Transcript_6019:78-350(+)
MEYRNFCNPCVESGNYYCVYNSKCYNSTIRTLEEVQDFCVEFQYGFPQTVHYTDSKCPVVGPCGGDGLMNGFLIIGSRSWGGISTTNSKV